MFCFLIVLYYLARNSHVKMFVPQTYFSFFVFLQTLIKCKRNRKEVLLGLNEDEGSYFMVYMVPGLKITGSAFTDLDFLYGLKMVLGSRSGSMIDVISKLYKLTNNEDSTMLRDTLETILTDSFFICPVQTFGAG